MRARINGFAVKFISKEGMSRLRFLGPAGVMDVGMFCAYKSNNNSFCFVDGSSMGGFRSLVRLTIRGLRSGFFKALKTEGVGIRFSRLEGNKQILVLHSGRGHLSFFRLPDSMEFRCTRHKLVLFSTSLRLLKDYAFRIKLFRWPDAYKAKGIKYTSDALLLKPGKQRK
jgi:ribosomal protein L6P/L9E